MMNASLACNPGTCLLLFGSAQTTYATSSRTHTSLGLSSYLTAIFPDQYGPPAPYSLITGYVCAAVTAPFTTFYTIPYVGTSPAFLSLYGFLANADCPYFAVEMAMADSSPYFCGTDNCNTLPPPGPPPRPPLPPGASLASPPPPAAASNPSTSCASSCAAMSSTPVSCFTAVTYSNLPAGVSAPSPGAFSSWFDSSISPPALQACATYKVVCSAATVGLGCCSQRYLGATVTVQYVISSNQCSVFPPLTSGENWCSQMSSNGATCEYDDLQIEQTCSQGKNNCPLAPNGNCPCYNWASPVNLGAVSNQYAGDGLYLLHYCNTDLCNGVFASMDSTNPGSFCQNSQIANAEAAAVAAIAAVLIGSIVGGVLGLCCCVGGGVYCCCVRGRERCCGPKRQQGVVVVNASPGQQPYDNPLPAQSPTRSGALIELASKKGHDESSAAWREARTADGSVYYINDATRETSWSRPSAMAAAGRPSRGEPKQAAGFLTPPARGGAQRPSPWREMRTPDGQVYFVNDETRETSWTRP